MKPCCEQGGSLSTWDIYFINSSVIESDLSSMRMIARWTASRARNARFRDVLRVASDRVDTYPKCGEVNKYAETCSVEVSSKNSLVQSTEFSTLSTDWTRVVLKSSSAGTHPPRLQTPQQTSHTPPPDLPGHIPPHHTRYYKSPNNLSRTERRLHNPRPPRLRTRNTTIRRRTRPTRVGRRNRSLNTNFLI